jgi:hypothetical protein
MAASGRRGGLKKTKNLRGHRRATRGPSPARKPMPMKRCEWCWKVIERQPGEKSKAFKVRRFCGIQCMAKAREAEKKVLKKAKRDLVGK